MQDGTGVCAFQLPFANNFQRARSKLSPPTPIVRSGQLTLFLFPRVAPRRKAFPSFSSAFFASCPSRQNVSRRHHLVRVWLQPRHARQRPRLRVRAVRPNYHGDDPVVDIGFDPRPSFSCLASLVTQSKFPLNPVRRAGTSLRRTCHTRSPVPPRTRSRDPSRCSLSLSSSSSPPRPPPFNPTLSIERSTSRRSLRGEQGTCPRAQRALPAFYLALRRVDANAQTRSYVPRS